MIYAKGLFLYFRRSFTKTREYGIEVYLTKHNPHIPHTKHADAGADTHAYM